MKNVCSLYGVFIPAFAPHALQLVKDAEIVVQRDIDAFHNQEVATNPHPHQPHLDADMPSPTTPAEPWGQAPWGWGASAAGWEGA